MLNNETKFESEPRGNAVDTRVKLQKDMFFINIDLSKWY